ncbi:MAG: cell division protein FtsQ/DivIB [Acidimicrobiales bacterium]
MSRRRPVDIAPGEARRPRRHRRVITVVAVVVLAAATLVAGGEWVIRQSYFRVRHVTLTGLVHESSAAVLAASGLAGDPPMIDVSAGELARRLAVFPWIGHVAVTKHWPNTLDVAVRERLAVAVAFDGRHRLRYVDAAGHDLGAAPLDANLPTLDFAHPRDATWPYERAGWAAAFVAARLPVAFAPQVSVIIVDHRGNVTLTMTTPVHFVLGAPTQLHAKFVAIASVIAHETLRAGDVVDVSVPGALAVTGPPPS